MKKFLEIIRFGFMLPIYIIAWLFMAVVFALAAAANEAGMKKAKKGKTDGELDS